MQDAHEELKKLLSELNASDVSIIVNSAGNVSVAVVF